ncbi:MAG: glycoside hydrolase family 2 TIM barrel-domain containing protein [Paludibacteraceae bacterium]
MDLNDSGANGLYLTTSNVSATSATLEVRAKIVNQSSETKTVNLKAILKNPDTFEQIPQIPTPRFDVNAMRPGGIVGTLEDNAVSIAAGASYEFKKQITIANPHLWNGITDPYRYQVDLSVSEGTNMVDVISDYVGFRFFSADKTGFYLNGKLYPLRGVNRHQDWKDMGYAISENEHNIDFGMIYEIGANAVRMAHYPQDPYFHGAF